MRLKDGLNAKYQLQMVGPGHGSPLEEWIRMGKPDYPTNEQIARLIDASRIIRKVQHSRIARESRRRICRVSVQA